MCGSLGKVLGQQLAWLVEKTLCGAGSRWKLEVERWDGKGRNGKRRDINTVVVMYG